MWLALIALTLFWTTTAVAQTVTDGDTLKADGKTWRIHGIDAPELSQQCADAWPAGRLAATELRKLTAGRSVICEAVTKDRYGRTVGKCFAGGVDLGAWMVRNGWAWAYRKYSGEYIEQEDAAIADNLGIHKHAWVRAWEYRARRR